MRNLLKRGLVPTGILGVLAVCGLAWSADFQFSVSGNGLAQGSDRQAALDEAYDKASEQARLVCSGGNGQIRHDRIDRTGSNCASVGSDDSRMYSCMVFVRAECVTRTR